MSQAALVFVGLLIASILPWVYSKSISLDHHSESDLYHYGRLAKRCFIDDYPLWLQRKDEFLSWFEIAQLLKLPIQDDSLIQEELKKYRLQHQCLRVHERLALSLGPG